MKLNIELGQNNAILRKKCEPVRNIDKKLKKFIKDMIETMHDAKGVGIAAPQVGVNIQACIVTLNDHKVVPMINPEITWKSEETKWEEEGCLSLPQQFGEVERPVSINVNYLDEKGNKVSLKLSNFNARVVQHEIDHLNGVLFTDYPKKPGVLM